MKKLLLTFIAIFFVISLNAQNNVKINLKEFKTTEKGYYDAKESIKKGNSSYNKGTKNGYFTAIIFYLEAYEYNSENAELNYKIGVAYIESIHKKNSLKYLLKADSLNKNLTQFIHWNLGRAYHHNLLFNKAIEEYTVFKNYISKSGGSTEKVKKRIKECENGIELLQNPINVEIEKLSEINSKEHDYCPLITTDESVMIFTSRREGGFSDNKTKRDGMFYEDIYISYNIDGTWTTPKNVGEPLNTDFHDATVGLSPDGQKLFLYQRLDIYSSELKGDKWTEPIALPKNINTSAVENSACLSFDGNELYFIRGKTNNPNTSNSDIYVSYKKDDEWSEPKKLSSRINTKYDEDGVFMHPDGKTLFFSSKGHNTIGGFDIFKTVKQENNTWSEPVNIGYPINTPDDDLYFVLAASGKNGYYSSIRSEGEGLMDIYKINFAPKKEVQDTTLDEIKIMLTIVKGVVTDGETNEKLEAIVEIYDNQTGEVVLQVKSNSSTGKYLVSLPSGRNYGMEVRKEKYLFHSENFNVPATETYQEITKDIELFPIKNEQKVVLRNIFFDIDKSELRPESFTELDKLKHLLIINPDIKIEISGHTDNQGSYNHNIALSKARAQAVVDYLIKGGISSERLSSRGASWDEPISTNDTEEGRQLNRRVEFKVVK